MKLLTSGFNYESNISIRRTNQKFPYRRRSKGFITSTSWGTSASWRPPSDWPTSSPCQPHYRCTVYRHGKISLQTQWEGAKWRKRSRSVYLLYLLFVQCLTKVVVCSCLFQMKNLQAGCFFFSFSDDCAYLFFLCKRHECQRWQRLLLQYWQELLVV